VFRVCGYENDKSRSLCSAILMSRDVQFRSTKTEGLITLPAAVAVAPYIYCIHDEQRILRY
jgi:hypothetical protein